MWSGTRTAGPAPDPRACRLGRARRWTVPEKAFLPAPLPADSPCCAAGAPTLLGLPWCLTPRLPPAPPHPGSGMGSSLEWQPGALLRGARSPPRPLPAEAGGGARPSWPPHPLPVPWAGLRRAAWTVATMHVAWGPSVHLPAARQAHTSRLPILEIISHLGEPGHLPTFSICPVGPRATSVIRTQPPSGYLPASLLGTRLISGYQPSPYPTPASHWVPASNRGYQHLPAYQHPLPQEPASHLGTTLHLGTSFCPGTSFPPGISLPPGFLPPT